MFYEILACRGDKIVKKSGPYQDMFDKSKPFSENNFPLVLPFKGAFIFLGESLVYFGVGHPGDPTGKTYEEFENEKNQYLWENQPQLKIYHFSYSWPSY